MNLGGFTDGPRSRLPIPISRQGVIGVVLVIALVSFEMFNFDTTQYALANLLGETNFIGIRWASILAVAFCAIDFAGLAHLLTPEQGKDEPKEIWYLMGAWLLGATMNAMMTWWAVSLTLLEHSFGNEVLSREQLLRAVPIFVAALVWLTRILFIGALSVAGENVFAQPASMGAQSQEKRPPRPAPTRRTATPSATRPVRSKNPPRVRPRPMPQQAKPQRTPDGWQAKDQTRY